MNLVKTATVVSDNKWTVTKSLFVILGVTVKLDKFYIYVWEEG